MSIPSENLQHPRVCQIKKSYPEQEFGFNLHGERGKKGQYIGSVDPGSPAADAGLKAGDKIVAVNGVSVIHDDHKHVVAKIRENPLQCTLSVIDDSPPFPVQQPAKRRNTNESESQPTKNSPLPGTGNQTPSKPRLCRLNKTSPVDEYGFNLHAETGRGHYIGKVDPNSLAEAAGLVEGQRIVGINKTLIYPSTAHKEVVSLIKQNPVAVLLLVASREIDDYYKIKSLEFNFDDAEIIQNNNNVNHKNNNTNGMNGQAVSSNGAVSEVHRNEHDEPMHASPPVQIQTLTKSFDNMKNGFSVTPRNGSNGVMPRSTHQVVDESDDEKSKRNNKSTSPRENNSVDQRRRQSGSAAQGSISANEAVAAPSARSKSSVVNSEDDLFNLSSAELRQRMAKNRRPDPRCENTLSFEEKHKIINNL